MRREIRPGDTLEVSWVDVNGDTFRCEFTIFKGRSKGVLEVELDRGWRERPTVEKTEFVLREEVR